MGLRAGNEEVDVDLPIDARTVAARVDWRSSHSQLFSFVTFDFYSR